MKKTNPYIVVTVILFGLLLAVPGLLLFALKGPQQSGENRAMAEMPAFKFSKMDAFPSQFDRYVNDHFPFRNLLLDLSFQYSLINHQSPIPQVVIGKNDFLFSGEAERTLFEGTLDFSEEKMKIIVDELLERQARYRREGIRFYVVVAPTAYEIYPEYLPDYLQRINETATDRFCRMMSEKAPQIPFLYLKDKMLYNKQFGRLYYKNDNHWNPLGGYYATDAILNLMRHDFPQLPDNINDKFTLTPYIRTFGNLGDMLVVRNQFRNLATDTDYKVSFLDSVQYALCENPERKYEAPADFAYPWEYEWRYTTNQEQHPKILVIRDSYCAAVIPFLTPWFKESVFIFDAWKYGGNDDIIRQEKPDIILLLIYEPHIRNIIGK